ncbi:MAG: hypothetical protein Q8O88_03660 [bacterium]|nr:hypothetical protein [bacterium]
MATKKITIGQTIFLKGCGHNIQKSILQVTVSKVGNKWFEVKELPRIKFEIETLLDEKSNYGYGHNWQGYLSMQEINDKNEQKKLTVLIQESFKKKHFTLEQLRESARILGLEF